MKTINYTRETVIMSIFIVTELICIACMVIGFYTKNAELSNFGATMAFTAFAIPCFTMFHNK